MTQILTSVILLILFVLILAATVWISNPLSDEELLKKAEEGIIAELEKLRFESNSITL